MAIFAWLGYHLERGGMPLHDAVLINSKGATTENQGAGVKYMGKATKGCILMIVCVIWFGITTPPW